MFQILFSMGMFLLVNSQAVLYSPINDQDQAAPTPYAFSYSSPAIGGASSHQESGDEFGRKTGSYSIEDEDGRQRLVQYVADENGFRVSISTNEPGTSSQDPADVDIESSAEEGVQPLTVPAAPLIAPVSPAVVAPIAAPFGASPISLFPARPEPIPFRRQIQPQFIPFQPTAIPFQPSTIPFQPAFLPISGNNQFFRQPPLQTGFIPISRNQPQFLPFDNRAQPIVTLPQNFLQFRPSGGNFVLG